MTDKRDTRDVDPPLRRQWKEKECARPTSFPPRSAYRTRSLCARSDLARACSPANASFECDPAWGHGHVLGEGQRTLPLLHYSVRGTRVDVHTCVLTYVRTSVRVSDSWRVRRVSVSAQRSPRSHGVHPLSTWPTASHCGRTRVEGIPTNERVMLPCYVARQLDILRSARIPCRASTRRGDEVIVARHRGMHARTLVPNTKRAAANTMEMRFDSCLLSTMERFAASCFQIASSAHKIKSVAPIRSEEGERRKKDCKEI